MRRQHARLLEEREHVGRRPALDDLAVCDANEVAVRPDDLLAARLDAEERVSRVRPAHDRVSRHLIALGDHVRLVDLEQEVGHRLPEGPVRLDHGVERGRSPTRVVVEERPGVDELAGGDLVRVAERLDQAQQQLLVGRRRARASVGGRPGGPPHGLGAVCDRARADCGGGAHLLHHPDHVELAPPLGDLAVLDTVDPDRGDGDLLAAGRDSVELGLLRPVPRVADRDRVALDDQVVDLHVPVGKRGAPGPDQVDEPLGAHPDRLAAGAVDDHVRRDDLVGELVAPARPALLVPAPDDLLCLVGCRHRRGYSSALSASAAICSIASRIV